MPTSAPSSRGARSGTAQVADERRDAALARWQAKRSFTTHLAAYLAVNLMLVVIWVIAGGGFFWPLLVVAVWGAVLVPRGRALARPEAITAPEVERETTGKSRSAA